MLSFIYATYPSAVTGRDHSADIFGFAGSGCAFAGHRCPVPWALAPRFHPWPLRIAPPVAGLLSVALCLKLPPPVLSTAECPTCPDFPLPEGSDSSPHLVNSSFIKNDSLKFAKLQIFR